MLIYLMGKDVDVTNITSEGIKNSSLSLAVFNGNKKMNSVFIQTESLTNNMIGITEYGRMTFNSENTDLSAVIDVSADVDGEIVTKTLSVQACLDTVEGTELGSGGGGGTEYTAGCGITISNNEISADSEVLASKEELKEAIDEIVGTEYVYGDELLTYNTGTIIATLNDYSQLTSSEQFIGGRKAFIKNNVLTLNISATFSMNATENLKVATIGYISQKYKPKEDVAFCGMFFSHNAVYFIPIMVAICKDSGRISFQMPPHVATNDCRLVFSGSYEINNVE